MMSRENEGLRPAVDAPSMLEQSTWTTMLATENLTTYIAEVRETVVGTASFTILPNLGYACRPSGLIEAMVVSSGHRRQGVAG